jgi:hypothetical protein
MDEQCGPENCRHGDFEWFLAEDAQVDDDAALRVRDADYRGFPVDGRFACVKGSQDLSAWLGATKPDFEILPASIF